MAICEVCGDDYDKALRISTSTDSRVHVFDSFECAMQALAPSCARCNCTILGHGVESDGVIYCSAHCATAAGVEAVRDRADTQAEPPARAHRTRGGGGAGGPEV
jgi:hypothetical protein